MLCLNSFFLNAFVSADVTESNYGAESDYGAESNYGAGQTSWPTLSLSCHLTPDVCLL